MTLKKFHSIKVCFCPIAFNFVVYHFCFRCFQKTLAKFLSCFDSFEFRKYQTLLKSQYRSCLIPTLSAPSNYISWTFWRHDNYHDDTCYNGTQHDGLNFDSQQKSAWRYSASAVSFCWVSLCWMSLCWVLFYRMPLRWVLWCPFVCHCSGIIWLRQLDILTQCGIVSNLQRTHFIRDLKIQWQKFKLLLIQQQPLGKVPLD